MQNVTNPPANGLASQRDRRRQHLSRTRKLAYQLAGVRDARRLLRSERGNGRLVAGVVCQGVLDASLEIDVDEHGSASGDCLHRAVELRRRSPLSRSSKQMSSSDGPTPTIPTSHNVAPVTSTATATATVGRDVGALTRSDGVRRCPRARRWRRSRPILRVAPSVLDLGRTPEICTLGRSPPTVSYARTQGWRAGGATAPPLTGAALWSWRRASLGPYMPAKRLREPAARSRMGANG
jgi:hypothetical protein